MDKRLYKYWFVVIAAMLLWFAPAAMAQEVSVSARVDSNSIRIGDQVKVHFEVHRPANVTVTWPATGDSLQGLELVTRGNPGQQSGGAAVVDTASWTVTGFDSGMAVVPPLPFTYSSPGDTAKKTALTQPIPIFVHGIAVDTSQEIKDIKPPLSVPITWSDIWPWLLVVVVLAALIWLFIYIRKKKSRGEAIIPEAPRKPAHEIALDALRSLESESLWKRGMVKEYHSKLTDILRAYIERRFDIMALEMTTDEIMTALKPAALSPDVRAQLNDILVRADFAKFAKFLPSPQENELSMTQAVNFVQSTWRTAQNVQQAPAQGNGQPPVATTSQADVAASASGREMKESGNG